MCLSCADVISSKDYTHIAFDISEDNFHAFSMRLQKAAVKQWKINKSEGESLYIFDPDDHKLEIHVGSLASRLASLQDKPYQNLVWL